VATGSGRNPYPWVARIDVEANSRWAGQPRSLRDEVAAAELNPAFRRIVHEVVEPLPVGEPRQFSIEGHEHRIILLAETDPPGHLYLQEIIEDEAGKIVLQLPGDLTPKTYRVAGWMADDQAHSDTRVSFYDRIALRPQLGQWQLWRLINTTGDTHPIHIHQSQFQPLDAAAAASPWPTRQTRTYTTRRAGRRRPRSCRMRRPQRAACSSHPRRSAGRTSSGWTRVTWSS
jgi:spore coat protein A